MVSLPTRGTSRLLTASSATSRTVQRAHPSGGSLQTFGQLQQRQRAQDHSNRLHAPAQQLPQLFLVLRCDFDAQGGTSHTPVCAKTLSI